MVWKITIHVYPYSTGRGADEDQKAAGERTRYFFVQAHDMREAMKMAECFAKGIESGPAVWKAPIFAIALERDA